MSAEICVSHITAWAPGLFTHADWKLWAAGKKRIESSKDVPKLEYTTPLFRRRLSQISRMTIQVVHDELEESNCSRNIKQVFISCRGEIVREFSISKMLLEEKSVLPASFSLSVFNTPIALATLASGLKGGYTVLFPSKGQFRDAFSGACAPVLSEKEEQIMVVYADELPAAEYRRLGTENCIPLAFAAVLSSGSGTGVHLSDIGKVPQEPALFLKQIILKDTSF